MVAITTDTGTTPRTIKTLDLKIVPMLALWKASTKFP